MPSAPVARYHRVAHTVAACLTLALAGLFVADPAAAKLVLMHGYADLTSATLWIQTEAPGRVTVTWRPDGQTGDRQIALDSVAANDNVVVARLTGMKPGATAEYRVEVGSERRDGTSPLTSRPPAQIDGVERNNPDLVPGTLVAKRQFGLIRVSGPGTDRRVTLEARDGAGKLLRQHDIQPSELRFPRQ